MRMQMEVLTERLVFINRTIDHAQRACLRDAKAPAELRQYVGQMGLHSWQMQRALQARDETEVRERVKDLARICSRAQQVIRPADGMDYALRSAVILTHIELAALQHQLN